MDGYNSQRHNNHLKLSLPLIRSNSQKRNDDINILSLVSK